MVHRDDHHAARERIEALERELAAAEERAERAERGAAGADASPTSAPPPSRPGVPAARGRTAAARRYELAAGLAIVALELPAVVVNAVLRVDLDAMNATSPNLVPLALAPALLFLPIVYVLARLHGAPSATSALGPAWIGGFVGWALVLGASSDAFLGDFLAEPPLRWVSRGILGGLASLVHAGFLSSWTSQMAFGWSPPPRSR